MFPEQTSVEILSPARTCEKGRRAFEALRYRVYVEEERWETPNILRLETDEFDARSVYITAVVGGETLAGCRIIDGRRMPLPFEMYLATPHTFTRPAEISRMIIRGRTPREQKMLGRVLYPAISEHLVAEGYSHLCGTLRCSYFKRLRILFPSTFDALKGRTALHGDDQFVPFGAEVRTWARFFDTEELQTAA